MIAKDIISLINGIVDDFEGKVLTKPYILRKTENKTFSYFTLFVKDFNFPNHILETVKIFALESINKT